MVPPRQSHHCDKALLIYQPLPPLSPFTDCSSQAGFLTAIPTWTPLSLLSKLSAQMYV